MKEYRTRATRPPSTGESTQLIAISPILPHWTISSPPVPVAMPWATAAPTMPPMMEWVVDTGQPLRVAISSHSAAPSRAAIMM